MVHAILLDEFMLAVQEERQVRICSSSLNYYDDHHNYLVFIVNILRAQVEYSFLLIEMYYFDYSQQCDSCYGFVHSCRCLTKYIFIVLFSFTKNHSGCGKRRSTGRAWRRTSWARRWIPSSRPSLTSTPPRTCLKRYIDNASKIDKVPSRETLSNSFQPSHFQIFSFVLWRL